ncbi:MAG: hypothetical protein JWP96_2697, partial [Polaromonas sp.]|nr:hypothetical protein [Polaromonas sp.]
MLIRNATLIDGSRAGLRCENGVIAEIGAGLRLRRGEAEIDARGGALLPALHDHHIHFLAFAAARASVRCGPPQVRSAAELAAALQRCAGRIGAGGWLRGVGYHPSVAGDIDRHWLDRHGPPVPLRLQHRSGRLWIFNTRGLDALGDLSDSPLERIDGELSGRLYDADTWLRQRLGGSAPDLRAASLQLASYGVAAITDTTPGNNLATAAHFERLQAQGELRQDVLLMGDESLHTLLDRPRLRRGALKLHLHESALPDIDEVCQRIRRSHAAMRPVAVHCVTLIELLFTLSAFEQAGTRPGDRIEHAAIAPPEVMAELVRLGL